MSPFDVRVAMRLPKKVRDVLRRSTEGWKPLYEHLLDIVLPLPSAKELGRSDSSFGLPMREFTPDIADDVYTWEDWEVEVRRDYPVAWFLRREVPKPFERAWKKADDAVYWLKCHTLPSYNFHTLDLRNPGGGETWDYGWRDRTEVLLWASFKILTEFVEKEGPFDIDAYCVEKGLTEEQARAEFGTQYDGYREVMSLYRWWKTEREEQEKRNHALFEESCDESRSPEARRAAREVWHLAEDAHRENDQKQLLRLVAVRGYLWT